MGVRDAAVAIIEGQQDAGLTVTLVNRICEKSDWLGAKTSEMQTNAGTMTDRQRESVSSKDMYTSRYKLVHCNIYQSCLPIAQQSFPRVDTFGNLHSRSEDVAFAESLRKYPMSPVKSISSELIQRILSYTQSKCSARKSVKNTRCFHTINHRYVKSQKRANPGNQPKEISTDKSESSTVEKIYRYKDTLNTSYNYLKTQQPQVRYLDVKRTLRDCVPFLRDNAPPPICPSIRSRYLHHRLHHHMAEKQTSMNKNRQNSNPSPCSCSTKKSPQYSLEVDKHRNRIKEEINKWLQDIPVHANYSNEDRMKREKVVNNLVDSLSDLKYDKSFLENAKSKLKECLNELPMWTPNNKKDQEEFKEKVTDDLTSKINELFKSQQIEDTVTQFLQNVRSKLAIESDDMMEDLSHKLQSKIKKIEEPSVLKSEVEEMIKKLPLQIDEQKQKILHDLTIEFTDKLSDLSGNLEIDFFLDEIRGEISNWLKDVPQLQEIDTDESTKYIHELAKTIQSTLSDSDEESKLLQMRNAINDWLYEIKTKYKVLINKKDQSQMTHDLIGKLLKSGVSNLVEPKNNSIEDSIKEWFQAIPKIPKHGQSLNDNIAFKDLSQKLNKLQLKSSDGDNEKNMRQQISHWLDNILQNKRTYLDDKTKDHLVNELISKLKMKKDISENNKLLREIKNWLGEIENDDISCDDMAISNLITNLDNIQRNISAENVEQEVRKEVKEWVNSLSKKSIKTNYVDQNRLQKRLMGALNLEPKPTSANLNNTSAKTNQEILKNGTDMPVSQVNIDRSNLRSPDVTLAEAEKIGMRNKIYSILDESGINTENHLALVDEITDLLTNNITARGKENYSNHDLLNVSKQTDLAKLQEESLFKNFVDLEKKLVDEKETGSYDKTIKKSTNKTANRSFQTSTPCNKNTKVPFYPKLHIDSSLLSAVETLPKKLDYAKSFGEIEYAKEVKSLIQQWIDNLPFNIDAIEQGNFKEDMIHNLMNDIIDRQKYLQISKVKTNPDEELENLKFQVYKSLNKLLDIHDLTDIMPTIENLLDAVKKIPTPQFRKSDKIKYALDLRPSKISLQNEILLWLKEIPAEVYAFTDSEQKEEMVKGLVGQIILLRDVSDPETSIKSTVVLWLCAALKNPNIDFYANNLINQLKSKGLFHSNIDLIHESSQFIEENLIGALTDWLRNMSFYKERISVDKLRQEQICLNLAREIKNIIRSTAEHENIDDIIKKEIVKHIKQFPMDSKMENDEILLNKLATHLSNYLKSLQMFHNISDRYTKTFREQFSENETNKAVKDVVSEWSKNLPLQNGISHSDIKEKIDELIAQINVYVENLSLEAMETNLKEEITKNLKELPLLMSDSKLSEIFSLVGKLVENIKEIKINQTQHRRDSISTESSSYYRPTHKTAADILYDNIRTWCENLPIYLGDSKSDLEKVKTIKDNVASKLLHKIAEINMNPEIVNDNFLYEDVLQYEIDKILQAVPKNTDLDKNLPILKRMLIGNVISCLNQIREELTGLTYKKQLTDTISRTIPLENLSPEARASFEVLKDNVADAFISLHYTADDTELKDKFKQKIFDRVNEFCNHYLKKQPGSPLEVNKLNQDLYSALKNVPLPNENLMRSEVEQIKIRDEINEWLKNDTLQQSGFEELQKNKMISRLANSLRNIEKDKSHTPQKDVTNEMKAEIMNWLKKYPKKDKNVNDEDMATKLVNILKGTEKSRKCNISKTRPLLDYSNLTDPNFSRDKSKSSHFSTSSGMIRSTQYTTQLPASSLSIEDREHLQRIRERSPIGIKGTHKPTVTKDAAISPIPMENSCQTKLTSLQSSSENSTNDSIRLDGPENKIDVYPRVIVKEYRWDSYDAANTTLPQQTNQTNVINQSTQTLPSEKQTQTSQIVTSKQNSFINREIVIREISPSHSSAMNTSDRHSLSYQPIKQKNDMIVPLDTKERDQEQNFSSGIRSSNSKTQKLYQTRMNACKKCQANVPDCNKLRDDINFNYMNNKKDVNSDRGMPRRVYPDHDISREIKRCECGRHMMSRCKASRESDKCNVDFKNCSRCWGSSCPHPSYMFFRRDM